MKKNLLVILAFLPIVYAGCADNAYTPTPPAQPDSYLPETYGSTWRYRDSIYHDNADSATVNGIKIDTLTLTINGNTTDVNGMICYNAIVSSVKNGPGTVYFHAHEHILGLLESTPPFGMTNFDFLVDTAKVGYTWGSTPSENTLLNGYPVTSINTVKEKNITKVVGGITFTQVVHTTANFQISINGAPYHNIAYYDFYLAKNIGLIEKDAYVYGNLNETETIIDYVIK
jgi:hypothetical protein